MAGAARLLAVLVVGAMALAGCVAQPSAPAVEPAGLGAPLQGEPAAALSALRLEGRGCIEGGGHSVHPKWDDYLPAPWEPADVLEDVGDAPLTSEWFAHPEGAIPQAGDTMGNYHATVVCQEHALDGAPLDVLWGFVGMRVEPPPFDTGPPADRHYLVTVLATSDHGLHELFHQAGFHATLTTGVAQYDLPGVFHNVLDTEDHGIYESYFKTKEKGAMPAAMRLWWQMENENGTFSPIALDLVNTGGRHVVNDGYGTFWHLRTEDHSPLPGAVGEIPGLAYEGFDRVVQWGPRPAVVLEEAYVHT